MKKFNILVIIMFIAFHPIWSQEGVKNGFIIKYDVISLLGDQVSNSAGIRLGAEARNGSNMTLAFDAMFIFPCKSCGGAYYTVETEKTVGFTVSADHRFWLYAGKQAFSGFHVGPRLAYQYTRAEMHKTYDNGIPNNYSVYRNMGTFHVMTGYQLRIAGPLYFDPELGIGLRYISSWHKDKKGSEPGQHEFPYDKDYESGSKWFPSFDLNIKLGIKL
ncbi:MAG: hypothetical protein V2I47_00270 [Bacteroidales bacterium]|jgi:hypothetical protein|nr:hypothetical protein [Bacteroidales bacterium]